MQTFDSEKMMETGIVIMPKRMALGMMDDDGPVLVLQFESHDGKAYTIPMRTKDALNVGTQLIMGAQTLDKAAEEAAKARTN